MKPFTDPTRAPRAGIIGVGGISHLHAEGFLAAGAELVALADVDPKNLAARGAEWSVTALYDDFRTMLGEADLDVVSIAAPNVVHHPAVLAAADAGVHVLVEKPLSLSLDLGHAMIDACAQAGVVLQVGHQMRSDAAVSQAKRLIERGDIGDVAFVRLRQAHDWGGASEVRASFATRGSSGGGTLLDNGCHMMDLARYIGGPVDEVYARIATRRWPVELEDTSLVSLRFQSGALGSVENGWTSTGWEEGFWIYGTRGALEFTNRHGPPVLRHSFRDSPGTNWTETDVARYEFAGERAHYRQIRAFLSAVRGEAPVMCTGEDGLEAVRLVLAAYESAQENRPISMDEAPKTFEAAVPAD